jgi:magnesium transporter
MFNLAGSKPASFVPLSSNRNHGQRPLMPDIFSSFEFGQLKAALDAGNPAAIAAYFSKVEPAEALHAISLLSDSDQSRLLQSMSDEAAAKLVDRLHDSQAAQMIERLSTAKAAAIVRELPSDEQADVMGRLSVDDASAILEAMPVEEARDARRLMSYPPDSAGGLMITEFLAYRDQLSVGDVLDDLRAHADRYRSFDVQYAYVVSAEGRLVGVLRLRDLLLSMPTESLADVMIGDPLKVRDTARLEELERFFDRRKLFGVPAVNEESVLVGVVRSADVEKAAEERSTRSFLKFMGIVGGEELRTMRLSLRSMRRLSWLTVNILLNMAAASVIAFNQETLSAVIALAVFLPIISDMSGCSGNQAVAVSLRELTLGIIKPYEAWRVFRKEAAVGIINGIVLGILLGLVALAWKGNLALGGVVAVALAANTLIAVCFGGLIPLALRGIGQDPALASGPILTTITEISGFFIVLKLASAVLPSLTQ